MELVSGPPWQRSRCHHKTTYTHENIANVVLGTLPGDGWAVITPPEGGEDGFRPCNYPSAPLNIAADALERYLGACRAHMGCADMIEGSCETVASALAARVTAVVQGGHSSDRGVNVLRDAYALLESELVEDDTVTHHIAVLFQPARAAMQAAEVSRKNGPSLAGSSSVPVPLRWKPFLWAGTPSLPSFVNHHCLGVGRGLAEGLENCNERSNPFVLPMYVLAYLWDECSLTDSELSCVRSESAVYSLHCMALVVDPTSKVAYLADPNGTLIPGSNLEFLRLPLSPLSRGHRPSTSMSQYDRDQDRIRGKKLRIK